MSTYDKSTYYQESIDDTITISSKDNNHNDPFYIKNFTVMYGGAIIGIDEGSNNLIPNCILIALRSIDLSM